MLIVVVCEFNIVLHRYMIIHQVIVELYIGVCIRPSYLGLILSLKKREGADMKMAFLTAQKYERTATSKFFPDVYELITQYPLRYKKDKKRHL